MLLETQTQYPKAAQDMELWQSAYVLCLTIHSARLYTVDEHCPWKDELCPGSCVRPHTLWEFFQRSGA